MMVDDAIDERLRQHPQNGADDDSVVGVKRAAGEQVVVSKFVLAQGKSQLETILTIYILRDFDLRQRVHDIGRRGQREGFTQEQNEANPKQTGEHSNLSLWYANFDDAAQFL